MTALAKDQLAAYRSRHTIKPLSVGSWDVCEHDLIRIHERRGRGRRLFLHDHDAIRRLVRLAPMTESEARADWGDR